MLIPVLLFIVGLLCLIKGGDWFVDGATGIARRFHVPELLIGATVVSIGTTLPEVMVSTTSALTGHGEIAYGNAIGSVICNASLIAAITIAVKPGKVDPKSLRTPVLFFFVAAAFYAGVAYTTGYFSRPVGLVLLAMFVAYIVCNILAMKNAPAPEEEEEPEENATTWKNGKLYWIIEVNGSAIKKDTEIKDAISWDKGLTDSFIHKNEASIAGIYKGNLGEIKEYSSFEEFETQNRGSDKQDIDSLFELSYEQDKDGFSGIITVTATSGDKITATFN